jgi:EAL domain-containing protein (putative c-di-GMP-specific phosphodiesterase class I)
MAKEQGLMMLRRLGCDQIQGHLLGRPTPAAACPYQLTPCSLGRGAVLEVTANSRGMRWLL